MTMCGAFAWAPKFVVTPLRSYDSIQRCKRRNAILFYVGRYYAAGHSQEFMSRESSKRI